jgi:hypothetical protein
MSNVNYSTSMLTVDQFGTRCGVRPAQSSVQVPVVKHIVHRTPVIYETVSEEVTYMNVPVQHSFEQRDYAQTTKLQCAVAPAAAAAPCKSSCGC